MNFLILVANNQKTKYVMNGLLVCLLVVRLQGVYSRMRRWTSAVLRKVSAAPAHRSLLRQLVLT